MEPHSPNKDSHDNLVDASTPDTSKNSPSKGAMLKRAREEQGYSIEAVHEATKIPLDVLRAIEEGYTVRTLSPFYYRGFLKIYARYLGVEISTVVDHVQVHDLRNLGKKKISVDYEWQAALSKFWTHRRKHQLLQLLKIAGILIVAFFVFKWIGQAFGSWRAAKKENSPKTAIVSKKSTKPSAKNQSTSVSVPPVSPKASTASAKVEKPAVIAPMAPTSEKTVLSDVTLTVRAKKETWLSVKGDGATLFQSTLSAGGVETWSANETIELSGKNINELEFEVNGKTIGTLGRADRRAKKIVVTKEGLTVIK